MRTITVALPDDLVSALEIRAAIDDLTLSQGVEALLSHLVAEWQERKAQNAQVVYPMSEQ